MILKALIFALVIFTGKKPLKSITGKHNRHFQLALSEHRLFKHQANMYVKNIRHTA
ncbi:hypothetical protein NIES23_38400 [Trichormus variabilis NIES-23]|uniref:Uncharacterized protein n=1 Tax=Trichormus variabilis NIES-23 TaxID=1973479 RepID=A0A1Z4KPZ9_ANAVA|nr:asr0057 [Nostoc sp. PCC 7120 = FACHB-418]BAY71027.1 hypothetical protein NIES23_38400 [Trichormus variabilis NIES-23]